MACQCLMNEVSDDVRRDFALNANCDEICCDSPAEKEIGIQDRGLSSGSDINLDELPRGWKREDLANFADGFSHCEPHIDTFFHGAYVSRSDF